MDLKKILIISGPTATGKTKLAIDAAIGTKSEIINFDSLLFYKELNIGTAKPDLAERKNVIHHMIDIASINHPLNAAEYCRRVIPLIDEIHSEGVIPILVGGSGFYLKALLLGMYPTVTPTPDTIMKSNQLFEKSGITPFWDFLIEHDPISTKKLHINDHYRVRRAVEFFWTSGYPISEAPKRQNEVVKFYKTKKWQPEHIYLNIPKDEHYSIIIKRAEIMIKSGLINEVENLFKNGFTGLEKPMQSIGYKETIQFLKGDLQTETELIEAIFISTRQLAKSQRTWFQSVEKKKSFNPLVNYSEALKTAKHFLN